MRVIDSYQTAMTSRGLVEYRLEGAGPLVVVLNGGHCTRRARLSHERLAGSGFSVLTPSRPGYDSTPASVGQSAQEAADALAELIEALGFDHCHVIGISAAGPTAIALAQRHPSLVPGLVLESSVTLPWDEPTKRGARLLFGSMRYFTWELVHTALRVVPHALLRIMMAQLTTLDVGQVLERMSEDDTAFATRMFAALGPSQGFLLDVEHSVPGLGSLSVPTLVMHSSHDGAVSEADVEAVMCCVPGAEFFEAASDSHLIWIGPNAPRVWDRRMEFLRATS